MYRFVIVPPIRFACHRSGQSVLFVNHPGGKVLEFNAFAGNARGFAQ